MSKSGYIGKYKIEGELGRGGFGVVYRAFDPAVERRVAIKQIVGATDPDTLRRFHNEAAALGQLRHPNIVVVYDTGEENESPYIVMEYLDGRDLAHILEDKTPLSVLQKVRIMSQVASALDSAHQRGIVHRDVKPANIMVLEDRSVKLMDFGISILTDANATRLTGTGFMIGTIHYMAPEQFSGGEVSASTDIFSFGVILYELLTGSHPFTSSDASSMMYRIMSVDPPAASTLVRDIPPSLNPIIERALAKDRTSRYASLDDLLLDLRPVLQELQQSNASAVLPQVPRLIEEGRLEEAHAMVREILDLDPGNREARRLRDLIQSERQRLTVQPKIEGLLREAEEQLTHEKFDEALRAFESALRLAPHNSVVQERVEKARSFIDRRRRAGDLLQIAQTAFHSEQLTQAHQRIQQALQIDPEHAESRRLQTMVEAAINKREHERFRHERLDEVERLMVDRKYNAALTVLDDLDLKHPGLPEVRRLRDRLRGALSESERQQRLNSELAAIKTYFQDQQFRLALQRLERLRAEFGSNEEIERLHTLVKQSVQQQQRTEGVNRVLDAARAASAGEDWATAVDALERGLRVYHNDPALLQMLTSTRSAQGAHEQLKQQQQRRQVLDAARQFVDLLCQQKQYGQAEERLGQLLAQYPDEAELIQLRGQVERARARQQNDPTTVPNITDPQLAAANGAATAAVRARMRPGLAEQEDQQQPSGTIWKWVATALGSALIFGALFWFVYSRSSVSKASPKASPSPSEMANRPPAIVESSRDGGRLGAPLSLKPSQTPVFTIEQGTSAPPSFSITLASATAVDYEVRSVPVWLKITPAKGQAPGRVTAQFLTQDLAPGKYDQTIEFQSPGASPTLHVQLTVKPKGDPSQTPFQTLDPPKPVQAIPSGAESAGARGGLPEGNFQLQGEIPAGADITINNDGQVTGPPSLRLRGNLWEGAPVEIVRTDPPLLIVAPPSATTKWLGAVLRNSSGQTINKVKVYWKVK